MRPALWIVALGLLGLALEAAAAHLLPRQFVPDLALLVPVAAALCLGPAEGLILAAGIGLAADMLSGTLLGQQAMLRMFEFGITRVVSGQLDLRRPLPLLVYAAVLSLLDALAMAGLSRLFLGPIPFGLRELGPVLIRACTNALGAPLVAEACASLVERASEQEARREMRLETQRPGLR